jgi:hypothetical protein
MNKEYKPVEGCEECEFMETACAECIMYGEAELIKPDKTEEGTE